MSGTPEERKDAIGQPYTRDLLSVVHKFDHCACVVCGDHDHALHTTCVACDSCCCDAHVLPSVDEWEECEDCYLAVYECECDNVTQPHQKCMDCPATWCLECGVERNGCSVSDCTGSAFVWYGPGCPNCNNVRCGECGCIVCWGCSNSCLVCKQRVCTRCFPQQACSPLMYERPDHTLAVCYQCLKTSPIEPPAWFWHEMEGCCMVHARMEDTSLETYDPNVEHSDGDDEEGGDEEE